MWWKITFIAIILCGTSPEKVGAEMWKASPTIQALIKMITSGKFRFPTADCDYFEHEEMRTGEYKLREEVSLNHHILMLIDVIFSTFLNKSPFVCFKEYKIAEVLFLPSNAMSSKPDPPTEDPPIEQTWKMGSRTSARQREKHARMLAMRREKERAQEKAGKSL